MKLRTLKRFIERKLGTGPLTISATSTDTEVVFSNNLGRIVGIIDRSKHYDLHDMHNKDDKPGKPTAQILKGKRLIIRWTDKTCTVRSEI